MGNSSSKKFKNPLDNYSQEDIQRLNKGFQLYGHIFSGEKPPANFSFIKPTLFKAIKSVLNYQAKNLYQKQKNDQVDIYIWAATAQTLLASTSIMDKCSLIDHYPEGTSLKDFVRDLASTLKSIKTSSKLIQMGSEPSEAFIFFLFSSCCPKTDDLDLMFLNDISGTGTCSSSYPNTKQNLKLPHLRDYLDWFPRSIYVQRLWSLFFAKLFLDLEPIEAPQAPSLYHDPLPNVFGPKSTLISVEDWFLLDTTMDKSCRPKKAFWNNVFSSKTNGNSWTVFSTAIEDVGTLLITIREKKGGHVFGVFVGSELVPKPSFQGNSNNFLFGLNPDKSVYLPTSMNDHYQYFNYRTATFPNGLGFGGQFDYFGLWIDQSFLSGHSKGEPVSSTYGNPILSSSQEFEIDYVEAWCINEKEVDERFEENKRSALQANPEAMELLEMAGKKMWTKDLPEKDPDEDEE